MVEKVEFLKPAEMEFEDAVDFYNQQASGLGYEFAIEVKKSLERIIKYPDSWTKISNQTRKCKCKRFPYNIVYYQHRSSIIVVAIMHTKRKPKYWIERLKES